MIPRSYENVGGFFIWTPAFKLSEPAIVKVLSRCLMTVSPCVFPSSCIIA